MMSFKIRSSLVVLGISFAGCTGGPSTPTYSVDAADEPGEDDESARVRRMQAIKIFNPDAPEGSQYEEWTADQLTGTVEAVCGERHWCTILSGTPTCADTVLRTACDLAQEMCVAETLNEIAEAAVIPVELAHPALTSRYTVPPQSEPARLAILNEVRFYAQRLTLKGLAVLNGSLYPHSNRYNVGSNLVPSTCDFAPVATTTTTTRTKFNFRPETAPAAVADGRRASQVVAAAIVTGERLSRQSAFAAAEKTVAVAEWDRGSAGSLSEAQRRVFSRPELSRAAAAHILVGGSQGLRLATELSPSIVGVPPANMPAALATSRVPESDAFCAAEPLSASAQRAVTALRQTGISPQTILGSNTTQELVTGPVAGGSVQERLPFLRSGTQPSPYEEFGANVEDFKEARGYLIQEINAFNRTKTAIVNRIGTSFDRYAGTVTPAPLRPIEYYTAVARQESHAAETSLQDTLRRSRVQISTGNGGGWSYQGDFQGLAPTSLSAYYGDVATWLRDMTAKWQAGTITAPTGTAERDLRPLYVVHQRIRRETTAVVSVTPLDFRPTGAPSNVTGIGYTVTTRDAFTAMNLVDGEDGMTCALNGDLEGGSCAGVSTTTLAYSTVSGNGTFFGTPLISGSGMHRTKRAYLYGTRANGKKELVASLPALNLSTQHPNFLTFYYVHAIMPEIESKVADYLRPSREWCTHAEVACNGEKFDARMPLENELSDDNNGVENSWEYFLDRAEAAAGQADQLGQQYLSSSLTAQRDEVEGQRAALAQRSQVDNELETVQQICGLSTDVDTLLGLFGQSGNLEALIGSQCTTDTDCAGAPDAAVRQCIGGRCLIVPEQLVKQQDVQTITARLSSCLGAEQVIPNVVVGDHPVCIRSNGPACDVNDMFCPVVVPNGSDPAAFCAGYHGSDPTFWKPVTNTLGFIQTPNVLPYQQFQMLRTQRNGGFVGICRTTQKPAPVVTDWFKIEQWSTWHNNPTFCSMSTMTYDVQRPEYTFPYFEGPDPEKVGRSVEILKCPTAVDYEQLKPLLPETQLFLLENVFRCTYDKLMVTLGTRLLNEVPDSVVGVLKQQGPTGSFASLGGEYAQSIADLRSMIVARSDAATAMGEELQGMIQDLYDYRTDVKVLGLESDAIDIANDKLDVQREINRMRLRKIELEQDGAIFGAIVAIGVGVAAAAATGGAGAGLGLALLSAQGTAGGAATQHASLGMDARIIDSENKLLDLDQKLNEVQEAKVMLETARRLVNTRQSLRRRSVAIMGHAQSIQSSLEAWNGKLYELESLRSQASRALSRAVQSASSQMREQEQRLVRVTSNLAQLDKRRYEEAFRNGVRLSFLAKRAIEARLGVKFSEMTEKLPLLDAPPASWENEVCVASGLDYEKIRDSENLPQGALSGFLGSYVAKLRNVVDAYQLRYAFREGTDFMTVSLKDDVFRSQAQCLGPARNLLKETSAILTTNYAPTSSLTATPTPPPLQLINATSSWKQTGCAVGQQCVWLGETTESVGSFGELRNVAPLLVYAKGATLTQTVTLQPGDYALSWYQTTSRPGSDVTVYSMTSSAVVAPLFTESFVSHTQSSRQWTRHIRIYRVTTPGDFRVQIVSGTSPAGQYDWMALGAPMLELLSTTAVSATRMASDFQASDATGQALVGCPDADGAVFRSKYWTRGCMHVCPQGSLSSCGSSQATERCYWEAPFAITQRDIEAGRVLRHAGFAIGNYNYRVEEVALNVVGSAVRDCENSGNQSCYSSAYVPFSLLHQGPFTVRNHTGGDVRVNLFDGRIESAKALAAERYLTNPLSTTDQELLGQYTRQELRGRPLDGNYVVRIWEDTDFDFDAVDDVQLLLRYRYWTAQ